MHPIDLLRLQEQDRARWDQPTLARAMFHLAHSARGGQVSRYHLEAGIAACHCAAPDFASTDWEQILALYDRLVSFDQSPIIALNRAVALANVHGPAAGIAAIESIDHRDQLDSYYLLYAVLGDFEARRANFPAAAAYFRQALELAALPSERAFLSRRAAACDSQNRESTFNGEATPFAGRELIQTPTR